MSSLRIAILEPLGDPGIGTYTYELAEALTAAGVVVDVYTTEGAAVASFPRKHGFYPVLGSSFIRNLLRSRGAAAVRSERSRMGAGERESSREDPSAPTRQVRSVTRDTVLSVELAALLRLKGYDLVWSQWPHLGAGPITFWHAAKWLGLRVVHTAHNVFPHERHNGDARDYGEVYSRSDLVIAHSNSASQLLLREFPHLAGRVLVSKLGLYTCYERIPTGRASLRSELGMAADRIAILAFGGIRPYKNFDVLLEALALDVGGGFDLIVAGQEAGFDGGAGPEKLGRTRRMAEALGLADVVHLIPGPISNAETSRVFEASDIVALPYRESHGSGVLLLAMSFGKAIVATDTGGMREYAGSYDPISIVPASVSPEELLRELKGTAARLKAGGEAPGRPAELEWSAVVRAMLPSLERVSGGASKG